MTKMNKWVSSLAAGFIAVAGAVAPEPAQAQTQFPPPLTPGEANAAFDKYRQQLDLTLGAVARDEVRPLRALHPEECYTLYNAFNPIAMPNTWWSHEGMFFVPAINLDEAVIHTADGQMHLLNHRNNYSSPHDYWLATQGQPTTENISVGCYGTPDEAMAQGRILNQWQAETFLQTGIDKLSAAIKRGLPGPAP